MNSLATSLADAYVLATNRHDADAFAALFADNARVDDNGREIRGIDAIRSWADSEIFAAQVSLDVIRTSELNGDTVVTTKVDGTFDRTGLPDPVIIDQRIRVADGRIVELTCRLADSP